MENNNSQENQNLNDPNKVSLVYYYEIFYKWKKFILLNILIVLVASIILSFILPMWYKGSTSIMPPANAGLLGQLGAAGNLLKNLSTGGKLGKFGPDMGAYNYLAILKSRTAIEEMIKKYDLINEYNVPDNSMEKAIKEFESNVDYSVEDEDYISITLWDKRQDKIAEMTNYYIQILNRISIELATMEAKNNREIIEKRYLRTLSDLRMAEDSLKNYFKDKKSIIALDDKASGFGGLADIYATKVKKEIEVEILSKTVSKDNSLYTRASLELKAIEDKLSTVPDVGIESLRKLRTVLINQKLMEILMPLYEQAKIEEQKDIPVVVILDKAKTPEKKDKPKRMILVGLITGSSIIILLVGILVFESFRRSENYLSLRSVLKNKKINKS